MIILVCIALQGIYKGNWIFKVQPFPGTIGQISAPYSCPVACTFFNTFYVIRPNFRPIATVVSILIENWQARARARYTRCTRSPSRACSLRMAGSTCSQRGTSTSASFTTSQASRLPSRCGIRYNNPIWKYHVCNNVSARRLGWNYTVF
jgi:hypothetical protein